jgi:hypothetical protein
LDEDADETRYITRRQSACIRCEQNLASVSFERINETTKARNLAYFDRMRTTLATQSCIQSPANKHRTRHEGATRYIGGALQLARDCEIVCGAFAFPRVRDAASFAPINDLSEMSSAHIELSSEIDGARISNESNDFRQCIRKRLSFFRLSARTRARTR